MAAPNPIFSNSSVSQTRGGCYCLIIFYCLIILIEKGHIAMSGKRVMVKVGIEKLVLGKEVSLTSTTVLFKVLWSLDLQHQHHLGTS